MPPQTHVQFVPFRWEERDDKVLMARDADRDWVVLDTAGGAIVAALDQGATIEEVQGSLRAGGGTSDVLTFTRELQAIGFVEALGDGHRGSSRLTSAPAPRAGASWHILVAGTCVAVGYVGWALASGAITRPDGTDLVLPGVQVGISLMVLVAVALATTVVHELGHILVARQLGLSPRVTLSRSALWAVARTSLVGIWGLERRLRWRPIAAGLMMDAGMLASAAAVSQVADAHAQSAHVARLALAVLAARIIWQAQWYLRSDLYFIFAVQRGAVNLRHTARLWLLAHLVARTSTGRRARSELSSEPASDVAAARMYCLSLPIACLATAALWGWLIVPFGRIVIERL